MAAQFSLTKGRVLRLVFARVLRLLFAWMAPATSSLPVPVSPSINTVESVGATVRISSITSSNAGSFLRFRQRHGSHRHTAPQMCRLQMLPNLPLIVALMVELGIDHKLGRGSVQICDPLEPVLTVRPWVIPRNAITMLKESSLQLPQWLMLKLSHSL